LASCLWQVATAVAFGQKRNPTASAKEKDSSETVLASEESRYTTKDMQRKDQE